jgi:hypothetical protein
VTWIGALVGFLEGGLLGFAAGSLAAELRNQALKMYAMMVRWRGEVDRRRDLLDKL